MIQLDFAHGFPAHKDHDAALMQSEFKQLLKEHAKLPRNFNRNSRPEVGFLSLPFQDRKKIAELKREADAMRKKFDDVLLIGIGGSALGAAALLQSLTPFTNVEKKTPRFHFLDNPESDAVETILRSLKPRNTLVLVISKSGETTESLAIFAIVYAYFKRTLGSKMSQHFIIITENNQKTLSGIQQKLGCHSYEVPQNVGGRFSVLSHVGLVPAAMAGIDIQKLLDGAREVDSTLAYQLAIFQYLLYRKGKIMTVFFPYGKRFNGIADWYIQLLAESIGKNSTIGPTPLKAIGALDQHAQLQLFMDGPDNKFFIFLEGTKATKLKIPTVFKSEPTFERLAGHDLHQLLLTERKATSEALAQHGRPNLTLRLDRIDEKNVGALLFLLQLQTAYLGELFQVNAFDQPGVELGKKLTQHYLQR